MHIAREAAVYLPGLDSRVKPDQAQAVFANVEQAAHEAKACLHK